MRPRTELVLGPAARPDLIPVTHEKLGFVYIVLGDTRERDAQTVYLVTAQQDKAYELTKKLLLRWNKPEPEVKSVCDDMWEDKNLPAKEFCAYYVSAWLRSPVLVRKALWG